MNKFKKILSTLTACALIASSLAGFTASAAIGDVLMTQNFEETDWGATSRTDKAFGEVVEVETLTDAVKATMPETVTGKAVHFGTNNGQNVNVTMTMAPALSATADVYGVSFDIYLKNPIAGYRELAAAAGSEYTIPSDATEASYEYIVGFGAGETMDMFDFRVAGPDIYYGSATGGYVDTGIDTGDDGIWLTANLKCDTTTKKVSGTLTAKDGTVCVIPSADFASANATTISTLYISSIRYSGSVKGEVNSYIDNFVVTEAQADQYTTITINYVDGEGNVLKEAATDSAIVGNKYTVPEAHLAAIAAEDATKYYGYVSGGDEITVAEEGNTVNLVFELKDKLAYKVTAVDGEGAELATVETGYVVPGETVKAYADYTINKDGVTYTATANTANYVPTAEVADATIVYTASATESANAVYDFEGEDTVFTVNNEHMAVEIAEGVTDTKVLKATSTGSGTSKYGTASLDLSAYRKYKTLGINFDSFITSSGRVTLNVLDAEVGGYGDTGLFSMGTKDSNGYRINGTQNAAGGDTWTHTSLLIDFTNSKLYYTITNVETGALVVSGSLDITAEIAKSLTFISWYDDTAYIDNIEVFAADKTPSVWTKYEATYDAEGICTVTNVEVVADPASVVINNTDTAKTFVWNEDLIAYEAPAADDDTTGDDTTGGDVTEGDTTEGDTTETPAA